MSAPRSLAKPVRTTRSMKRDVTRIARAAVSLAVLTFLGWLGGCSDIGPEVQQQLQDVIVSDPVQAPGLTSGASAAPALGSAADEVTYVSLSPGTVPDGAWATTSLVGDGGFIVTAVRDGGFDPVAVGAAVGDSIAVVVTEVGGATVEFGVAVRAARPPVVVRTQPPRRKTDVALNAALVIVFSEPVAEASLSSSAVRLFRGTTPVTGTVRLLQGSGSAAAFIPAAPLAPNTAHRLVVSRAVRDLEGDALAAGVTTEFTTGQSSTGPAASITLSPDSVWMTGATYQMTATVRDEAGNMLVDQPVTWSTSDPSGLTVSPTGLVTALAAGYYAVTATMDGIMGSALVIVSAGPPASVMVSPAQATVGAAGDTIILTATVRDATGRLLDHPLVVWTSSDAAVATAAADSSVNAGRAFATVTGVSPGSVTITATSGTASGTASATVIPPLPVASVTVTPASVALVVQATRQLAATLRDANGKVLAGRSVTWTTDNAAVATIDASGLVTAVREGAAGVVATSEGVSDTAAITVTAISLVSVEPGGDHACGLTPNGTAYCWGYNGTGALGVDTTGPETCFGFYRCSTTPVAVTGGLTFSALRAGGTHTCGLTASGIAYCWGPNAWGELGNGSTTSSWVPVAVTGGLSFAVLSTGSYHTCGLTPTGAAYCWGLNDEGQLGASTAQCPSVGPPCSTTPVAVTGGLTFSKLSVGFHHTCGLTTSGAAYCWGSAGSLGDGSTTSSSVPVAVRGGLTFSAVSAGGGHTCALTSNGAAYCWGSGNYGQLGDGRSSTGENYGQLAPVAVLGGLTFTAVSAGSSHSCGLTTSGAAYCWGENQHGSLGDGSTAQSSVPVLVTGGFTFSLVAAGQFFTCGLATGGAAYSWGRGFYGQLGNGTTTDSRVPVKVAGQP